MEQKVLIFVRQCINKNAFHKDKRSVNIDKVDIKRMILSKIDLYGNKGLLK